ncbi:mycofactocin biosynthesis glycosyltransferase MftF [Trichlorobacter lovleyi]|uniref:mycofactocin biosynthesis glycosyltransferase MftF n=1 Tax=Trichlorobacter lovleyi TaxID=313985 RepID=UPI0023F34D91|nr:mycofactocin biosynthesis glycosyltransferase MftF [Trichlorobacter lovleyi]
MKYRLSSQVELVKKNGEHLLVCRSPLSMLRLNGPLKELISSGQSEIMQPTSPAETAVLEQLASKGFVERIYELLDLPEKLPLVSIVIPVKDRAEELQRCLTSLKKINYPLHRTQLIVVDDGSSDESPQVARKFGALLVPSGGCGRGPAAARNAGSRVATGDILAFIDSDCTASEDWLNELIPSFSDSAVAAVGGMVDGMCSESEVDHYEAVMSSLSLGKRARSAGSGNDTFYLPSCNLLVRRQAFLHAGGFNDEMHVGEDVDLTWRLRDKGWTITYLPAGNICHEHRSSVRSFMSRRFDYGTSEGMLQLIHPQRHKRMVIPPLLALLLALITLAPWTHWWSLAAAFCVLGADSFIMHRKLIVRGVALNLFTIAGGRLRALGSLVYYLSFHLVRYYSLVILLASCCFPIILLPFLIIFGCAAGVDYALKKPAQSFVAFSAVYMLEHLSYGSGVFWGCLRRGCFSSYRLVITRQMELTT